MRSTALDVSFSVVSGDGQSGVVGTTLAQPLVIKATDSRGHVLKNLPVSFVITSGGGSASPASATTNNQGLAQTSWRLGTSTSTPQRLEARATASGDLLGAFTATALPGPAAIVLKSAGDSQSAPVRTAVAIAPAVRVSDAYGNAVAGVSVSFAVASGGGSVTGTPAATNAAGVATAGTWTLGPALGANTLTATATGVIAGVTFSATGTIHAASASGSTVTAAPTSVVASSGANLSTITVTARDQDGFPVAGATVTVTATGTGNSLTQPAGPTDADGKATATLSSTAAGTKTVSAQVGSVAITQTAQIAVTAAAPARLIATAGNGQQAPAGEAVAFPPSLRVLDAFDNGVPGASVSFAVTAGNGSIDGSNPAVTDAAGNAALQRWTLGAEPGTNTVTATVSGEGITNNPLTFTATATGDFWRQLADMPTRRYTLGAAGANGLLYAIGGADADYLTTVEIYNPATNAWATGTPLSAPRGQFGVGVINGIIYVVGGTDNGTHVLNTVEAYDPATQTWTARSPMPTARADLSVAVVNGVLYAIGGDAPVPGVGYAPLGTVEAYDPATDTWSTKASMPTPRSAAGAVAVNGIIYAVGGADFSGANGTVWRTTAEAYDPASDSWSGRAAMPTSRYGFGISAINGRIYAAGGEAQAGTTDILEVYDPATNTWSVGHSMLQAIAWMGSADLNGLLWIVGGNHVPGMEQLEAYHP